MRRLAVSLALIHLFSSFAFAALTEEQRRQDLAAFDQIWNTVRDKHWDPSLGGVKWDQIRSELRPKVENAGTESEVRSVMADMLSRLHQSHFMVIPGSVYHDVQNGGTPDSAASQPNPEGDGSPGLDTRVIADEAVVFSVEPGSPAANAGVQPGWALRQIGGEDLDPVLRRVGDAYKSSTQRDMMLARAVQSRLTGPVVNPVEIEFLDGRRRSIALSLERKPARGTPARFGYLPESSMWIESRRIGSDIGYLGFNLFLDPQRLTTAFQKRLSDCLQCAGMIVDLRGNPGGLGLLASGLAGFFIDKPDEKLGTMYMRDLPLKFVVNPRPPVFTGALAVLVDGLSASTSEIFAGGLQDLKRARIFGSRSAGATLASMIERLPNGDGFQYAAAFYKSESGRVLEGAGVIPDESTPLTREALLAGHDPALEAAVRWIHEQTSRGMIQK